MKIFLIILSFLLVAGTIRAENTSKFCLAGQFDLGARYQGMAPASGEKYPTTWCVVTEERPGRVYFDGEGQSNPDMTGSFSVVYLAPDTVRVIDRAHSLDIEFRPADIEAEIVSVRHLDPARLLQDLQTNPRLFDGMRVETSTIAGIERLSSLETSAALPLRGIVDVRWAWDWSTPATPAFVLTVDGETLYAGTGTWRTLSTEDAAQFWQPTSNAEKIDVPGEHWPSKVDMTLDKLDDGIYLVRGVRSGFQHLVVDTAEGLVVGDAPAGWVEFHLVPPADMVSELGISGLSELLIDFLAKHFPGRPILATAITHLHDDHAGGARAFAAAGAAIYATRESGVFLANALNRPNMPRDRLSRLGERAAVSPIEDFIDLGGTENRVRIINMGATPHVDSMLGVWAMDRGYFFVSDIHVPRDDSSAPRQERAQSECWFARWAVANLPAETQVVNSHSSVVTPVSRLANYLDHPLCQP